MSQIQDTSGSRGSNDAVTAGNRDSFDRYYREQPRQRYPDLMFIHLLMVYAKRLTDIRDALVIGAGDGAEAIAVARLGARVDAVDISPTSVNRMGAFFKEDGVADLCHASEGDQTALAFPDASKDLIISWSVISYLTEEGITRAITEIHRVLRPGGVFIGLLESTRHSGPHQEGAEWIGPRTARIPGKSRTRENVTMTYFDENDVRQALSAFRLEALSHRVINLPPEATFEVGQWMVCCVKGEGER